MRLYSINSTNVGKNDAGNVTVQANIIHLEERINIGTVARQGAGGNISIESSERLYLDESEMTTSVASGKGSGGNITIANSPFVIMNHSQIIAQSDAGNGGNIHIAADQFIKSPESLISASSKLGLDGNVQINSLTVDLDAFMVVLPGGYVEAQLKHCTQEEIDNPSRFKINLNRSSPVPFGKPLKE